ncbi:MAG: hypothetical protein O2970_10250 [Proteobacteria bacterium]|nr:hypothetical protein [Pseudomonadota bacterium]
MSLLSRKEQETIITSFQRDYGKLIMQVNKGDFSCTCYKLKCKALSKEIFKIADEGLFEDDTLERLFELSGTICNSINNSSKHQKKHSSAA